VGGADAKKEEEVEEEEEEEDHFRDVPLVSLVRVLDKVGDHIKAAPLHGANLSAGACVWREGGGERERGGGGEREREEEKAESEREGEFLRVK
jgi:hypothetical protein